MRFIWVNNISERKREKERTNWSLAPVIWFSKLVAAAAAVLLLLVPLMLPLLLAKVKNIPIKVNWCKLKIITVYINFVRFASSSFFSFCHRVHSVCASVCVYPRQSLHAGFLPNRIVSPFHPATAQKRRATSVRQWIRMYNLRCCSLVPFHFYSIYGTEYCKRKNCGVVHAFLLFISVLWFKGCPSWNEQITNELPFPINRHLYAWRSRIQ